MPNAMPPRSCLSLFLTLVSSHQVSAQFFDSMLLDGAFCLAVGLESRVVIPDMLLLNNIYCEFNICTMSGMMSRAIKTNLLLVSKRDRPEANSENNHFQYLVNTRNEAPGNSYPQTLSLALKL